MLNVIQNLERLSQKLDDEMGVVKFKGKIYHKSDYIHIMDRYLADIFGWDLIKRDINETKSIDDKKERGILSSKISNKKERDILFSKISKRWINESEDFIKECESIINAGEEALKNHNQQTIVELAAKLVLNHNKSEKMVHLLTKLSYVGEEALLQIRDDKEKEESKVELVRWLQYERERKDAAEQQSRSQSSSHSCNQSSS